MILTRSGCVRLNLLNVLVDTERMNRPTYEVVQWTQHYRRIDGRWYRDAIARRADGALRLVSYPDAA